MGLLPCDVKTVDVTAQIIEGETPWKRCRLAVCHCDIHGLWHCCYCLRHFEADTAGQ